MEALILGVGHHADDLHVAIGPVLREAENRKCLADRVLGVEIFLREKLR